MKTTEEYTCSLCFGHKEVSVYQGSDGTVVCDPRQMIPGVSYNATGSANCPRCT